ncbi:PEP-CTERM sorting domain-containing protein [bacterium]|nr:MAG: PEP-CTERM sorting domain-containing protein [bacterium]
MRFNREITILIAFGALATQGAAQQLSGSVKAYASVSGGSHPREKSQSLQPGQQVIDVQSSDAGPYVTAASSAKARAGLVSASYDGYSSSATVNSATPYGSGYSAASFRDAVRLTGSTPLTLIFRIQQSATSTTTGSDALQTSAGNYGSVFLSGQGVSVLQTRQASGGNVYGSGFKDVQVTLQPGKWYTLMMEAKSSGDTQDVTKPYTETRSMASSSLTSWFELPKSSFGTQSFGTMSEAPFLESESGHTYDARVQAVPEPASMAVLGLGALGVLRRRAKKA